MSTWTKLIAVVALALGLLAAPGTASAAIVITNSNAGSWQALSVTPTASADFAFSGTQTFTVSTAPTNSVLVVNYTQVAQSNAGNDLNTTVTWNGVPLTRAINQVSANTSAIYAEIFYLFNPTAAVNGSLVVSSSGRDAVWNAYTLSGVNTFLAPTTFGKDTNSNTSTLTTAASTPGGAFASIVGAWRTGTSASGYIGASGPSILKLWTTTGGTDASPIMSSVGAYIPSTAVGATTITQTASTNGSRNELAVAIFSALPNGLSTWSVGGSGSWNVGSNWGGSLVYHQPDRSVNNHARRPDYPEFTPTRR